MRDTSQNNLTLQLERSKDASERNRLKQPTALLTLKYWFGAFGITKAANECEELKNPKCISCTEQCRDEKKLMFRNSYGGKIYPETLFKFSNSTRKRHGKWTLDAAILHELKNVFGEVETEKCFDWVLIISIERRPFILHCRLHSFSQSVQCFQNRIMKSTDEVWSAPGSLITSSFYV